MFITGESKNSDDPYSATAVNVTAITSVEVRKTALADGGLKKEVKYWTAQGAASFFAPSWVTLALATRVVQSSEMEQRKLFYCEDLIELMDRMRS